jgi:hypothetical protein
VNTREHILSEQDGRGCAEKIRYCAVCKDEFKAQNSDQVLCSKWFCRSRYRDAGTKAFEGEYYDYMQTLSKYQNPNYFYIVKRLLAIGVMQKKGKISHDFEFVVQGD